MRRLTAVVFGFMFSHIAASAQTIEANTAPDDSRPPATAATGVIGADAATNAPSYAPLTASERWRMYFVGAFGPGAILRSAAAGGIAQWEGTPKEWKQGSEAFGDRFGSAFATHVIRKTLETGAAAALHEDNRYFRSTDTGFWRRTKHAVGSVFVARNPAGQEHLAYSRFGGALGAAFISRAWQPPSETRAGDAAVNFGVAIAIDAGWNVFKEFRPRRMGRHF